jgi:hypothetical protein
MKIKTISLHLSMKVQPERFEPFDVGVGYTVELDDTDDPTWVREQVRKLAHEALITTLRDELNKIYGPGKANVALLNKCREE